MPSVELYDIAEDRWSFTATLPKPLYGGSATMVKSRFFFFGGEDPYREFSNTIYEYIPRPAGADYGGNNAEILSFWKEHQPLDQKNQFLIAIGYEL